MTHFITYAVYKDGAVVAAGSLNDCWQWLLNTYQDQLTTFPKMLALDLAEAGVHIAPVGDHHKPSGGNNAQAA